MASGASAHTLHCKTRASGRPFSIHLYQAAGTLNEYAKIDKNDVAGAGSPDNVILDEDAYVVDFVAGAATAGSLELISNGNKTGLTLDIALSLKSLNYRQINPSNMIPLGKGKEYRLKANVANTV